MLTSDLLITKIRGDTIVPAFISPDGDHLELAGDIIQAFKDHTGKKLGELKDILEEMEEQGFDYRLVRGLVALLERRCELVVDSKVKPSEIRRVVFTTATGRYPVVTQEGRAAAIKEASLLMGMTAEQVEASMYADLENELVIKDFQPPVPRELVQWYNLSLAQTMMFRATELMFRASAKHKEVLRSVKRLGLMYSASYSGDRVDISIDGPASTLKLTERYGTSLARLLPFIVASPEWNIEATILKKDVSGNPRLYRFIMSEKTHGGLFGDIHANGAEEFDSEPEERFYESFRNAGTGWEISREPEPVITDRYLYIPDFLLEKDGVRVYLEIAGFWTAEYLKKKISKLSEVKDRNIIVLASSRSSCDAFKGITGNVILFDKKVPLKDVLDHLKVFEEQKVLDGLSRLKASAPGINGDVVAISGIAQAEGVPEESVRQYAGQYGIPGYVLAGEEMVKESIIKELEAAMPETMAYSRASAMIRSKGINSVDTVVRMLGYSVKWNGLDPDGAVIYRRQD